LPAAGAAVAAALSCWPAWLSRKTGTLADLEAWVQSFDFAAMLGVIDPR
jgi:hypothetical protein